MKQCKGDKMYDFAKYFKTAMRLIISGRRERMTGEEGTEGKEGGIE